MGKYSPLNIFSVTYRELHDLYDITMVPKLVILAPTGDLITSTGRKELQVNTSWPLCNKISHIFFQNQRLCVIANETYADLGSK